MYKVLLAVKQLCLKLTAYNKAKGCQNNVDVNP